MGTLQFSPAVRDYLVHHAVDPELAYGLGVRSDRDDVLYPYSRPRGGTFVRRRVLETGVTKQPTGEPLIPWWPAGRPGLGAEVLLTEGEPDALAALSALNGHPIKVASVPGTTIPVERVTAELATVSVVYLAMDGDDPGKKAADNFTRALQQFTELRIVVLGDGEDLASRLFREQDREGWLRSALEEAVAAPKLKPMAESGGYRCKAADRTRDLLARGIDPDRIELGELLGEVEVFLCRYVFMSDAQALAVTLWVAHAHLLDASRVTPYLAISSAEAGSGKTLLLEILATIVPRPWLTGRTTAAVLPRKVEKVRPTLLLDESDTAFRGDKDYAAALHGILNSGYKRSGATTLCVGQGANIDFRDFSTYCPKAFAGIKKLPDTIRTRSFPIRLVKIADEVVEEFDEEETAAGAGLLRGRLAAFASRRVDQLKGAKPERLEGVDPRTKEISKPLLAIAEMAGGDWPGRARVALGELAGAAVEDPSIGVELLRDIRGIFDLLDVDRIASKELRAALIEIDGSPWSDWRKGNPITQRAITDLLKPYGIRKGDVRFGADNHTKGYLRSQLEDAWRRHLPQDVAQTSDTSDNGAIEPKTDPSNQRQDPSVSPIENARKPHEKANVAGVAGSDPDTRDEGRPELPSAAEVEAIAREAGLTVVDPNEPLPPGAIVWDLTPGDKSANRGCHSHPEPIAGCRYCRQRNGRPPDG